MMGYANTSQIGSGLRQRLYSRAFIIGDVDVPSERVLYLVLDTQSGDTAVRAGILQGLRDLGPEYSMYGNQNVAVTGTHSHSGPAAWLNYLLPQITSKGFSKQSYQAIVDGALLSITRAHCGLGEGHLSVGNATVEDANINRSLYAYLANPKAERDFYGAEVDKFMTLLRFTRRSDGKDIGMLSWFPVHGTSMLGNNTIITGDNKGVAAYLMEQAASNGSLGHAAEGYVAGFSQANVGDTSPNVNGAYCEDGSNQACTFENSTCGGRSEPCHGRGPHFGLDDGGTKSCFEIGRRQYAAARRALVTSARPLSGAVRFSHTFHDMRGFTFPKTYENGTTITAATCPAALGYSFAAGTTDGPGAFDFTQNNPDQPNASPVWAVVRNLLHKPNETQQACHHPKPILLDAGESHSPYDWTPNIVDVQMFRVGQLVMLISPGEATTMAGRRWRNAVAGAATSQGILSPGAGPPVVVLGGPANSYTHYIATEEEYGVQRYEGASTLYGPHTLDAYINRTLTWLPMLADSSSPSSSAVPAAAAAALVRGPSPPVNTNRSLSFISGVVFDGAGLGRSFGEVLADVDTRRAYAHGTTATARFVAANPRNGLRLEDTYAAVERLRPGGGGSWARVRDDADWDLLFEWERTSTALGTSAATVSWEIGGGAGGAVAPGRYRLRYYGDSKALGGRITPFDGTSGVFEVV